MREEQWLSFTSTFIKAFNVVSFDIPTDKLIKYGLGKWTLKWTENRLKCQAQRIVTRGRKFNWRPLSTMRKCSEC